jgi:hypothetical protein
MLMTTATAPLGRATDLSGRRFNSLVVIGRTGTDERGRSSWLCRCDCGRTCEVSRNRLPAAGACGDCSVSRDDNAERVAYHKLANRNPGMLTLMRSGKSYIAYGDYHVLLRVRETAIDALSELLLAAGCRLHLADPAEAR